MKSIIILFVSLLIVMIIIVLVMLRKYREKSLELQEKSRTNIEFMNQVVHDMRTPLGAVIGLSKFGEDGTEEGNSKDYFRKIKYSTEYMLDLVDDVLNAEKLQNGTFMIVPEIVPYGESEDGILTIIAPRAKQKNIQLEISQKFVPDEEFLKEVKYLKIDKRRLSQIFINIISNAIKYTPNGGIVKICFTETYQQDLIVLNAEISDNGIGISKEFQNKIFKPFTRENNQYSYSEGGSGLGLYIVKNLVDAMNGEITFESEEGIGTTFNVTVDLEIPKSAEVDEYKRRLKLQMADDSLKYENILLCEDVTVNARIIQGMLEIKGAKVDWAQNGKIGVDFARKNKYDAILMDIRMPIMDGIEAAKEIRKFDKDILIIALSANNTEADAEKSRDAGMNMHLAKPVKRNELYEVLHKLKSF